MEVALYTVCAIVALIPTALTFWPLLSSSVSKVSASTGFQKYQRLIQERERLMLNLQDLENDHATNKVSETDFKTLRLELMGEISRLYDEILTIEAKDPHLSQILREVREPKS